jgi:hypothetical protein
VRCPGQDTRFWGPEDIYDIGCPYCGHKQEFFKDEPRRTCKNCGKTYRNPKLDTGCSEYCPFSKECIGTIE